MKQKESKCKQTLIEIKICEEDMQQMDDKKVSSIFFQLVVPLLKAWKRENQIDGACALNNELIEDETEFSMKMEEWSIVPKVIRRNRCVGVEIMLKVKTGLSTIKLNEGQNAMCDEKKLKIKYKLTKMEHTNKTGFIVGPNLLLSNTNTHDNETDKTMKLEEGVIEIKKECVYKQDVRSKVLTMNAVSSIQRKQTKC